jgi:hypothetical protein
MNFLKRPRRKEIPHPLFTTGATTEMGALLPVSFRPTLATGERQLSGKHSQEAAAGSSNYSWIR